MAAKKTPLYEKHIDYVMDTLLAGRSEARAYWELFKLKERNEDK